jgi:hypothetical protein
MPGPVKIGCSTATETRRLVLSKWSPFKLEIVTWIEGDYDLERRFHTLFRRDHTHCEWFRWSPELERVMEAVQAGTFDVDTLPEGRGVRDPRSYASGPMWSFRGFLSQRLSSVRGRGVAVPVEVRCAHDRFRGHVRGQASEQPADAAVVQSFLAQHGFDPVPFPGSLAAANCNQPDPTPSAEAA